MAGALFERMTVGPVSDALRPVFSEVDVTIERLGRKRITADRAVGERYSRITSIVGSAHKRHEAIIGTRCSPLWTARPTWNFRMRHLSNA